MEVKLGVDLWKGDHFSLLNFIKNEKLNLIWKYVKTYSD